MSKNDEKSNEINNGHRAKTFLITYTLSAIAACTAELATYPFDLAKTRLQIQGEIATLQHGNRKTEYRGMLRTGLGIAREEGVLQLWQGVTPALQRQIVYSGIRVVFYEYLRNNLFSHKEKTLAVWQSTVCGILAGTSSQFIASPTDLVKVQMQMEGRRRLLGLPPRVLTAGGAFKAILKEGGVRGLWKGGGPNAVRAALVNVGDLSIYDVAKNYLVARAGMPDAPPAHALASITAGFAAAALATPADVLKTRVMNQPCDDKGRGLVYKSSVDCLKKTVSDEGFFALYKGFLPVWIRMGPWAFIFWMSYEKLRHFMGVDQF